MKNWSIDEEKLKRYPEKYAIWRLESLVNFGLGDKKIKLSELKKYWGEITIDPAKRRFLAALINA